MNRLHTKNLPSSITSGSTAEMVIVRNVKTEKENGIKAPIIVFSITKIAPFLTELA